MKKKCTAVLLAVVIMVLALPGCGAKEIDLKLGEMTVLEDYIEFTPVNVLTTDGQLYAPVGNEDGWLYSGDMENPAYVVLVAKVKNLTQKKIPMEYFVSPTLTQGGKEYTTYQNMLLTENDTVLSKEAAIEAGGEGTVYILMDGQQETRGSADVALTFANTDYDREDIYHLKLDTKKPAAVAPLLEKDKTVSGEGYGKMTLKGVDATEKVEPSKVTKYDGYTYYQPQKSGNILLDVRMEVENQQGEKYQAGELTGIFAAKGTEVLFGYVAAETENGKDLKENMSLDQGESRQLHAVVEVPAQWKSGADLYIYFDHQYYRYTWDGEK